MIASLEKWLDKWWLPETYVSPETRARLESDGDNGLIDDLPEPPITVRGVTRQRRERKAAASAEGAYTRTGVHGRDDGQGY